jgi:hypothetical protein
MNKLDKLIDKVALGLAVTALVIGVGIVMAALAIWLLGMVF